MLGSCARCLFDSLETYLERYELKNIVFCAIMMNVIIISNIKITIAILYEPLRSEPLFFCALATVAICALTTLEGKKTVSLTIFVCPFSLIVFVFVVVVVTRIGLPFTVSCCTIIFVSPSRKVVSRK